MMDQESFLNRVRKSLRDGNLHDGSLREDGGESKPPRPPPYVPPRPPPQDDLVQRFTQELEAVGGHVHGASSPDEARGVVLRILTTSEARHVVRADTADMRDLGLDADLKKAGIDITVATLSEKDADKNDADKNDADDLREASFVADAGITLGDLGIAETGTLALLTRPGQGRVVSLLPPVHIAILRAEDIVLELAALFERISAEGEPPSALTFITGPSRTGDIELVLTIGVHGPKELHVVLVGGKAAWVPDKVS